MENEWDEKYTKKMKEWREKNCVDSNEEHKNTFYILTRIHNILQMYTSSESCKWTMYANFERVQTFTIQWRTGLSSFPLLFLSEPVQIKWEFRKQRQNNKQHLFVCVGLYGNRSFFCTQVGFSIICLRRAPHSYILSSTFAHILSHTPTVIILMEKPIHIHSHLLTTYHLPLARLVGLHSIPSQVNQIQ